MTYFPKEDPYNDKFLREEHKEFFKGWDLAMEEIKTYFANNEYETGIDSIDKILQEVDKQTEEDLLDWMATTRQEHIVGLIDGYSEEELAERGWKG